MIIHYGLENFRLTKSSIGTIGIFDGVHLAHRQLLGYLRESARQQEKESVVITFWPHPRTILQPQNGDLKLLTTIDEKIQLIKDSGIDHLLIINFTKEFSELSAEKFINEILIAKANIAELVMGYDHHFGKNREGNIDYLRKRSDKFTFKITEIPMHTIDGIAVNSSNIRKVLAQGDAITTAKLLGRAYSFSGKVIRGNQLGRKIGFPTANMEVQDDYKLIPANGVYAVKLRIENEEWKTTDQSSGHKEGSPTLHSPFSIHNGMMNIGFRPTVNGHSLVIEANIFDFNEEIYGQRLTIYIISRLRDEHKFDGIEALKNQLYKDKENVGAILDALIQNN